MVATSRIGVSLFGKTPGLFGCFTLVAWTTTRGRFGLEVLGQKRNDFILIF